MKSTSQIHALMFAALLSWSLSVLFSSQAAAQNERPAGKKMSAIAGVLQKFHIQPRTIDDSLSRDIFQMFLNEADPYRAILTKADVALLKEYEDKLDDEIGEGTSGFLDLFIPLYRDRLEGALRSIEKAAARPVDLASSDTLRYPSKALEGFPADSETQFRLWQLHLKNAMLDMMFETTDRNDSIFGFSFPQLLELEPVFRAKAHIREQRWINNLLHSPEGLQNRMISLFLNAMATCHDPHSAYFSPEEMKNFSTEMSGASYLFGIDIDETKAGQVYISGVIPGSPAWKSNELNQGDVLLALQWEGSPEVDLSWATAGEVGDLLSASVDKKLILTVLKADGRITTVTLLKERIRSNDDLVSSYILEGERKIGYICLPDFYTRDESSDVLGCANDVAKELVKLKKEGIEGLILDLQYNGGGSVREAVDLAGIFIEAGPVCIFQRKDEKPFTLKDMNIGTAWDGPLLVLVNQYSASASEVVSAALQDHSRAVIAGTPTYGKSTGQTLLPADTLQNYGPGSKKDKNNTYGFAKITTSRLYRISGSSHQKTGVEPDILIPDPFYDAASGERSREFAFGNDRTDKKTYYTPLPAMPLQELAAQSRFRADQDIYFRACLRLSDSLNTLPLLNYTVISLDAVRTDAMNSHSALKKLAGLAGQSTAPYKVRNHAYNEELNYSDEYRRTVSANNLGRLEKDVTLMEAFRIINDLINHIQNTKQ